MVANDLSRSHIALFRADRLREAREAMGWSQARLAREAGMSRSMASQIEGRLRMPSVELADRIAGLLEVSVLWLWGGDSADPMGEAGYGEAMQALREVGASYQLSDAELLHLLRHPEWLASAESLAGGIFALRRRLGRHPSTGKPIPRGTVLVAVVDKDADETRELYIPTSRLLQALRGAGVRYFVIPRDCIDGLDAFSAYSVDADESR